MLADDAQEATAVAAVIAGTGLREHSPISVPDAERWREVRELIDAHRLSGLATWAVSRGELRLSEDQTNELQDLHLRACRHCLVLEQRLLSVSHLLLDHDITHRVLKGAAAAHLDYEDPSHRTFRDLDLLVPADRLDEVVELAGSAYGYRPTYPEPTRHFRSRFGKGVALTTSHGMELDIHRTLAPGPYGVTIVPTDLLSRAEAFTLGDIELLALHRTHRFIHACLHATLTPKVKLWPLRDVATLHLHRAFSLDDVLDTAADWQVEGVIARAIKASDQALGLGGAGPLHQWAGRYVATKRDGYLLASYAPGRGEAARAAASLRVMTGVRPRLALLRSLAAPSRSFRLARGRTMKGRISRAVADVWRSIRP